MQHVRFLQCWCRGFNFSGLLTLDSVNNPEKRMNFSVLEEVKLKRSLEAAILQLKLRYFSHVMRAEGSLERDIVCTSRRIQEARKTTDAMA